VIRFIIDDQHVDGRAYEVRVYPHRGAYLRACNRRDPSTSHFTSHATTFHERRIFVSGVRGGMEFESPILGAIYLHEEMLDGEIVSHEATHAALDLFRRRHDGSGDVGANQTDDDAKVEEELALSVGRLVADLAHQLWKRKVWTRASAAKRKGR